MQFEPMIAEMRRLALQAGDEIMRIYGAEDFEVRAKSDASPVTEADEAADALISAGLRAAFPDIPLVTEEQAREMSAPRHASGGLSPATLPTRISRSRARVSATYASRWFSPSASASRSAFVAGSGVPGAANAAAVQLRPASPAETRYAAELLARLLDMGYMRRIAAARRRMAGMPEGSEKLELLGEITKLETSRKDLQAQVYGNTVG